jgi:hypothetical protein
MRAKGPAGLTNLSGAERAMLRSKVEGHVDPEIIAARAATAKALREAEEAWTRAGNLIGKRGGLHKGVDGGWSQPAATNAEA